MGCCSKFLLFGLNLVVFLVGICVIALASVVINRSSEYGNLLLEGMMTLPIWTLVFGIFITLIGFLGCCGAMRENKCMLYTYAGIVLILLAGEFTLGIMVLVKPEEIKGKMQEAMMSSFSKYHEDSATKKSVDAMQHELKCCGVDNYTDWEDWQPMGSKKDVPDSCCITETEGCGKGVIDTDGITNIFDVGCFEMVVNELKDVTLGLGITAIILALVQIACISAACGLGKKADKRYA